MFFHRQELQFHATPERPDAVYARKLQEVLGGQYGEITVAMQYGFQTTPRSASSRAPWQDDPTVAAIVGGTDPQHAIVAGAGARPVDSNGNPWSAGYVTASGNLLADFTSNANAEMQGRVQVARLYHMTDDKGVRDLLAFLLARDTMHQNQWIAAARELQEEGHELLPVPSNFPLSKEHREVSYQYINFSDGEHASEGSWASGPTPDGKGEFTYVPEPPAGVPMPPPTRPDARLYGTTDLPNPVEKAAGTVQDKLHRE